MQHAVPDRRGSSFFLISLIVIAVCVVSLSLVLFHTIMREKDAVALETSERLIDANELRFSLERKTAESRGYILSGRPELRDQIGVARGNFLSALDKIKQNDLAPRDRQLLDSIQTLEEVHQASLERVFQARARNASPQRIRALFETEVRSARESLFSAVDRFVETETQRMNDEREKSMRSADVYYNILILISIVTIGFISGIVAKLLKTIRQLQTAEADIEQRLSSEEQVKQKFLDLVNHLDQSVVWEATPEPFRFTFMSERALLLLGIPPSEILKRPDLFFESVHPDDLPGLKSTMESSISLKRDQRFEHRMFSAEGEIRWVQTGLHVRVDAQGQLLISGLTVDISALKKSGESLKKALRLIEDYKFALDSSSIVAITDQMGTITYVNDKFCEISKYAREELIGQNHRILNSGLHPKEFFENLWKTIASNRVWRGDIRNRAKDGTFYWVDTVIVPFVDESGKPFQYVSIRTDITSRKEDEERRAEFIQRLQKKSTNLEVEREVRQRFVSMLTHDLKTPLAAAKMGVQLITRQPDDPTHVMMLASRVIESLNRSEFMIRDLLDANRIEAGKSIPLQLREFNLPDLIRSVVDDLVLVHGDRFQLMIVDKLLIRADERAVQRILENLASNAVKYGDPDEPVLIALDRSDFGARLSVNNKGEPLSDDERQQLFVQFHRTQSAQRSGKTGWGIGLTLVRGLTESMGGRIQVQSHRDDGTTFIVELPLNLSPQIAREPSSPEAIPQL